MSMSWHHVFIYGLFFILGAYVVSKVPQVNLIGKVIN
jgi:hypothetical protein